MPTRPRLKQGETPQSESFIKRMRAFNRAVALAEATKAKAEQDTREASARESRDIIAEVRADTAKKRVAPEKKAAEPEDSKRGNRIAESGRAALEGRAASIEEAIEGGIQEANDANKPTKRKK